MRVLAMLHLYVPYHNAGAEVMTHELLTTLAAAGHEVDVLCSLQHPAVRTAYCVDGVTVYPRRTKADPFSWFGTDRTPDVVVTHLENTHRAGVLAQRYGVPHVVIMHNDFVQSRELLRVAVPDLVVYNTEWMRKRCEAWWTANLVGPPPRSIVVRPPVRAEQYATTPGDAITMINLTPEKGSAVFYGLAKRLPRKQFLGVVGAYGVQDIRPEPNVTVLGHVPPGGMRAQVYSRTKVLLVPSAYESYGRVAAEAVCSGIPVIAHPTEGLREALGDAGIFCDRDDLDAWERALRQVLTARRFAAASKRSLRQAKQLDPTTELAAWRGVVEEVSRCRTRSSV